MRNLKVGMSGPDVERLNARLRIPVGKRMYTRLTGDAVLATKWRIGLHTNEVNRAAGVRFQKLMYGQATRTPEEKVRAAIRARREPRRARPTPVAVAGALSIVPRAEWGAQPPRKVTRTEWGESPPALWVHYGAAPSPRATLAAESAQIRSFQKYHFALGWNDIGYAYLVGPSGNVYEGRGEDVWGSHCPGHNGEPSVCYLGGTSDQPTAAALVSILRLQKELGARALRPHRAAYATSCPGDRLVAALNLR